MRDDVVVTKEAIASYGACAEARRLFDQHYPSGFVGYNKLLVDLNSSGLPMADMYYIRLCVTYEGHYIDRVDPS